MIQVPSWPTTSLSLDPASQSPTAWATGGEGQTAKNQGHFKGVMLGLYGVLQGYIGFSRGI